MRIQEGRGENAVEDAPDLSSGSTSMARMELESRREEQREIRKFDFFAEKQRKRMQKRELERKKSLEEMVDPDPVSISIGPEWDPALDGYNQAQPFQGLPTIMQRMKV